MAPSTLPFTPVLNEVLEALARLDPQLSGSQWRVLCITMRETWGYEEYKDGPRRQKHRISITTFQKKTSLDRRHVHRALKELIARNIIAKIGNGNSIMYGIQKDYSIWAPLPKSAYSKSGNKGAEIGNGALPESATKALPESAPYKERNENLKESEMPPGPLERVRGVSPRYKPAMIDPMLCADIEERRRILREQARTLANQEAAGGLNA